MRILCREQQRKNADKEMDAEFFKEEMRSGYTVAPEMKKVWACEIEMWQLLDRICRENNIKYFAEGGTLLGVVRHKGFIPWDDDMDFAMLRDDYDRFVEIAPKYMSEPFFFQNYKTDSVKYLFSRIRNSNTTAMPIKGITNDANYGIFIDIFPLDQIPDNGEVRDDFYRDVALHRKKVRSADSLDEKNVAIDGYETFVKENAQKCTGKDLTILGLNLIPRFCRPETYYEKVSYGDFEGMKMPIPDDSESVLDYHYSNWRTTYVIGGGEHCLKFMDPDKSYLEYKKEES